MPPQYRPQTEARVRATEERLRNEREASASAVRSAHAKAVGGKKDRCSKGKSCSAACITRNNMCLVEIPESPAKATSRVRDSINQEKTRQLQLVKAGDFTSEKDAKRNFFKFKREVEKSVVNALGDGNKEDYEGHRQRVINYNKMLVNEGLDKKTGLVNVPVSWDRAQKVKKAYHRAYSTISDRAENAAKMGNRELYDREEKKLIQMQRRIGAKVGETDFETRGRIWKESGGPDSVNNRFLKGIRESPIFKGAKFEKDDDSLQISKMVGGHEVSLHIEKNGRSFSFMIDGSYRRPAGLSISDGMKIANETENMFRDVVSHMNEGSVVSVYPYDGDGRGEKRRRAYERYGFASVPRDQDMYGVVSMGVMNPATASDMGDFRYEGYYNFSEKSKAERVKLFYTMLWGEDPRVSPN